MKKKIYFAVLLGTALLTGSSAMFSGCSPVENAAEVFYDGLGTLVVGEEKEATAVSQDRYCYQQLDEEGRRVYDQLVATVDAQEESAVVSTKEEAVLERAFCAMLADYGEFFWISGYQYNTYTSGQKVIGLKVMPVYTMSREDREAAQQQVDQTVEEWLANLPADAGDYEKSKYVYETLIRQAEYNENAQNSQNILSVFLDRQTVCQGYAEAAAYLFHRLGIQAAVVTGSAKEEPHAWNLVRLDGEYYFMDVTWGNSNYSEETDPEDKIINYAYLNVTTEDLRKTHEFGQEIPVPECTAITDNYYRREGCYFEQWDPDAVGSKIREAWDSDATGVSVRFSDSQLYEKAIGYFIDNGNLSRYCRGMHTVYYIEDSQLSVLTLQF